MATRTTGLLADPRWERWAAVGGILFVVLVVIWALLITDAPDADDTSADIRSFYADEDDRGRVTIAGFALAFAGVFFLWFLASLRTMLRRAEGEPARLSALVLGAGVAMVGLLFAKNAVNSAVAVASEVSDDFRLDPELVKVLSAASVWLLGQEAMAGGAMVAAASVVALRTGVFPAWLAWTGLVVAFLNLLGLFLFGWPSILLAAWVLAVSVLMLMGRLPEPAAEVRPV